MFGISSVKIGIGTKLSNIWLTPTRTSSPLFQDFVFFFFLFFCVKQISLKMSTLTHSQVKAEKDRLIEAKNIAESEKRLYVTVCIQKSKMSAKIMFFVLQCRCFCGG